MTAFEHGVRSNDEARLMPQGRLPKSLQQNRRATRHKSPWYYRAARRRNRRNSPMLRKDGPLDRCGFYDINLLRMRPYPLQKWGINGWESSIAISTGTTLFRSPHVTEYHPGSLRLYFEYTGHLPASATQRP
jgi:hypothetical protein